MTLSYNNTVLLHCVLLLFSTYEKETKTKKSHASKPALSTSSPHFTGSLLHSAGSALLPSAAQRRAQSISPVTHVTLTLTKHVCMSRGHQQLRVPLQENRKYHQNFKVPLKREGAPSRVLVAPSPQYTF